MCKPMRHLYYSKRAFTRLFTGLFIFTLISYKNVEKTLHNFSILKWIDIPSQPRPLAP